MCLVKTLMSKIVYHVFYMISDLYINRLSVGDCCHVWQLVMPYPFCIIWNNTLTYKMRSYVIQSFPHFTHGPKYFSPITGAFCCVNCKDSSTPFSYMSHIRDAFIQLQSMDMVLWYWLGYPICMKISLFSWNRYGPIPFRKTFFILHSYITVKYVMLNLMKFRQHFALVSKYTTWKR